MKRTVTALCFAAAFSIATLGAQTTTTTPGQRSATNDKATHDVTITGCLAKDASGGFTLNNAHVDNTMASTTTGAGATTTAGTTGATTTGSPTSTNPSGSNMSNTPAMTWMLMGNDLEKHVGHKIQVTGKTSWDSSMSHGSTSTASAAGAGTTAVTPDPTTTAGAAGTTGTTGTLDEEQRYNKDRDRGKSTEHPHLDVQSVKMISTSCS